MPREERTEQATPRHRKQAREKGQVARSPDLVDWTRLRHTRVVLAAAHLDHDPANNRARNLRCLCQRCHLRHDRAHHLAERHITYRRRFALGDLFLGPYRPQLLMASSAHGLMRA